MVEGGRKMKTAVVVDDEPIVRLDLTQMLEDNGIQVVGQASDGFDAVEVCRQTSPDIVLMDIKMPVFDGLGAAETILQEGLSGCIVIISAFFDSIFLERAKQIGVTGYLIKPIEAQRLLPTIEVAFAQSQRLSEAREKAKEALEKLEQSRCVEIAKRLIAQEQGISESEAYRVLQQTAMNKRSSIASIAEQLADRNSSRKVVDQAKKILMKRGNISDQAAFRKLKQMSEKQSVSIETVARQLVAQNEGVRAETAEKNI